MLKQVQHDEEKRDAETRLGLIQSKGKSGITKQKDKR